MKYYKQWEIYTNRKSWAIILYYILIFLIFIFVEFYLTPLLQHKYVWKIIIQLKLLNKIQILINKIQTLVTQKESHVTFQRVCIMHNTIIIIIYVREGKCTSCIPIACLKIAKKNSKNVTSTYAAFLLVKTM